MTRARSSPDGERVAVPAAALADPYPVRARPVPTSATVVVPGSKSITNRALVCAALATGTSHLDGALRSDDTDAMVDGLRSLGAGIDVADGDQLTVTGTAGRVAVAPARVDARLSGTTSRFLLPIAALGAAPVEVVGDAPLRARPMSDLIEALVSLGVGVASDGGRLPATVTGIGPSAGDAPSAVAVRGDTSSQFVSGLLLAAPCLPRGLRIEVSGVLQSVPYVDMTVAVMSMFGADVVTDADHRFFEVAPGGYRARDLVVEPDASAASYFFAAAALAGGSVTVDGLGSESLQGDVRFAEVLGAYGARVTVDRDRITVSGTGRLLGGEFDFSDISDTAQTLAAIAPFATAPTVISGIGFIRSKETDRIAATVAELRRCGVDAGELPDGIRVEPSEPHAAVIRTYHDHRMAMSFAVLGLRTPGIEIADPGCVAKTFPAFWSTLEGLVDR